MSKQNWQAQIDATQDTRISHAEVGRILGEWYADYGGPSRIDEDVFLSLQNRLIPLSPGEPVQFLPQLRHGDVDPAKRRWLNGTFGGPVHNPDDPYRLGDVWVTAAASGLRVTVFLSSVRRQPHRSDRPERQEN